MRTLRRFLFSMAAVLWGLLWTGFMSGVYVAGSLFTRKVAWMDFCQVLHGRVLVASLGIRVELRGSEHFAEDHAAIVMANHRSILDIPVMVSRVPHLRFVAKKELARIPVFGWALIRSEHVLIDRADRRTAIPALQAMARTFGGKAAIGRNLMVFAEGTRSRDERVLPFKKGGFHLALDTGLPILPVSIEGNQHILPKGSRRFRPGRVTVTVHEPIPMEGKTRQDLPELMDAVRRAILAGLPSAQRAEAGHAAGERTAG
jgi:1-acyl-sn-glycerol-3-phosphate acyltransferase